jgi:hypothetical protein
MDAPTTASQAVAELNAAWQQSLAQMLRISPGTLQLLQPPSPAPTDSPGLWAELDAIPAAGAVSAAAPAGPSFAQVYGSVILNLKPPQPVGLQKALGDYYAPWAAYLASGPPMPAGGVVALYRAWAADHIPDPGIVQAGLIALVQLEQSSVSVAVRMYRAAQAAGNGFAYNLTAADLTAALASATNLSFSFQLPAVGTGTGTGSGTGSGGAGSGGSSSSGQGTGGSSAGGWSIGGWTVVGLTSGGVGPGRPGPAGAGSPGGGTSGTADGGAEPAGPTLFTAAATPAADALALKLLGGGMSVKASFRSLLQFSAGPLSQSVADPPLSEYTPWYYAPALTTAYQTRDNTLWNKTPPTWSQTFGPGGTLLRVCSGLTVADGIMLQYSVPVGLVRAEQQLLQAAAASGIWPFFVPLESPWAVRLVFAANRTTITVTCTAGNPQVLARMVTPIPAALGLSS